VNDPSYCECDCATERRCKYQYAELNSELRVLLSQFFHYFVSFVIRDATYGDNLKSFATLFILKFGFIEHQIRDHHVTIHNPMRDMRGTW
jgi:hypothetical protein